MPSPRFDSRAVALAVAGLALIIVAAVLRFLLPQWYPNPTSTGGTWFLSAAGMRITAGIAVSAGAWLLVLAWNRRHADSTRDASDTGPERH